MPTVTVGRDKLFAGLGKTYSRKEFEDLTFEFGIELDDVTTEKQMMRKELHKEDQAADEDEEILYKIEVPANRYDLLCLEGLVRALRIFTRGEATPVFTLVEPPGGPAHRQRVVIKPETMLVRPFLVCAVLRDVTFDADRYASFIDLQDKLHQNLCRQRTLVAIGTHDLSKLRGPFTYEALPPEDIRFVPLKQTREFTAPQLFEFYKAEEAGRQLRKFLPIIESSVVYPVLFDADRTVLSLPPIINGAASAISLTTRDVFIECTATDLTKARTVLNTVVTLFAGYCATPFAVEPVDVVGPTGVTDSTPDLSCRTLDVDVDAIAGVTGLGLSPPELAALLGRMQLPSVAAGKSLRVTVPPTRSDVLHAVDVMEDVAIAHGYNRLPVRLPPTATAGAAEPVSALCDLLRGEVAQAGFTEVLTFILCSHADCFESLGRVDDGTTAAIVANGTGESEMPRCSLLPGLLKTLGAAKDAPLPLKLFEVSDVVVLDSTPGSHSHARNRRRLAAAHAGAGASFEVVHGLLDRVMEVLGLAFDDSGGVRPPTLDPGVRGTYYLSPSEGDAAFLPGRQATVWARGARVGTLGVVHPRALAAFDVAAAVSALEIDLEGLLLPA